MEERTYPVASWPSRNASESYLIEKEVLAIGFEPGVEYVRRVRESCGSAVLRYVLA